MSSIHLIERATESLEKTAEHVETWAGATDPRLHVRISCHAKCLHQFWINSITFMDTAYGRDRSLRFLQYAGRMFHGLLVYDFLAKLSSTMALSRKGLRFFGPIKAIKALCDLMDDKVLNKVEKNLTAIATFSDGIYRLFDHVAFCERIKLLKLSEARSDLLDRFIEIFWLTEVIPMICREAFAYFNLRMEEEKLKVAGERPTSSLLVALRERKRKVAISLFKVLCCDLPCIFFVIQPAEFKKRRIPKIWCGFLGMFASSIGIYQNWPSQPPLQSGSEAPGMAKDKNT